ncbi:MAG: sulfatase-like hydrolase/transferase [Kiritimatiellae bacterium]|nr:sulfatase-like hydrolase/transferase [Kiritimatiellia bacterium]
MINRSVMPEQKQNVLLIVLDQILRDSLALYGGTVCQTPNIDRTFRDGIIFDNAYTPISLCSPARASLFTGKMPTHHGVLHNTSRQPYSRAEIGTPDAVITGPLATGGYDCGYVGKWHIGCDKGPREYGFQGTSFPGYGYPLHVPEYDEYLKANGHPGMEGVRVYDMLSSDGTTDGTLPLRPSPATAFVYDGIVDLPASLTEAGFVASRTVELLRSMKDKPFFITAAFAGPHHPALPSPEFAGRHAPADIPPWANFADDLGVKPRIQKRYAERLNPCLAGAPWELWQRIIARHFDLTAMIDDAIGKMMQALHDLGLDDRTLVILTTDHGDTLGCHGGLFDKGPYMYEETYRIPLLIRTPDKAQQRRSNDFCSLMDLYPTLLEIARVPIPARTDGVSLLPVLQGKPGVRECITAQFFGSIHGSYYHQMIRMGPHKYVFNPSDIDELYDLENDPAEMNNLVESPRHRDVLKELRTRLYAEMEKTRDQFLWSAAKLMGLREW